MKKSLPLLVVLFTVSMTTFARENFTAASHSPRVYIMMKHGKLIEVRNGRQKPVKKDVTLVNMTTIHPNGSIDASSGQNLQLKEGQCITMDGRIRSTKDMMRNKG